MLAGIQDWWKGLTIKGLCQGIPMFWCMETIYCYGGSYSNTLYLCAVLQPMGSHSQTRLGDWITTTYFLTKLCRHIHSITQNSACKTWWNPDKLCIPNNHTIITSFPWCLQCPVIMQDVILKYTSNVLFCKFFSKIVKPCQKLKQNTRKKSNC